MWKILKLGEACLVRRGTTITKKHAVEGDVPVIGGGTKPTYFHNEPNRAASCITVSGSGASAGFVNRWDMPIFASDCSTVEPKDETQLPQFVYYYLLSQQHFIYENFRSGAAQPHVYAKDIETLDFPVLPLAEQKRIVAKLDAAFSEIDRAIEAAEKCIENSKMIFQTLRNDIYQKVADTAPNVELETIAKLSRGHNPPKSKFIDVPKDGYVRFYQIRDAKSDKFATYVPDDSKLHKVTERDFLMNAYRYVGEVFRGVSGAFNVALCKLAIIDFEKVNEDYLYYMIPSHLIKGELLKTSARSLIPSMSVKELAKLKVPIPSFEEQKEISTKIIAVEKQQIVLLNIYKKKLYQLNYLKAAILAQELQSEAA